MATKRIIRDMRKAHECRVAQFGPDEQARVARQAAWRKQHLAQARSENPYLRSKVYSAEDLERARRFDEWRIVNPDRAHAENPHVWKAKRVPG